MRSGRKIGPEGVRQTGPPMTDEVAHPSMTMDPTIHTKVYVLAPSEDDARAMVENEDYSQAECTFHWLSKGEELPSLGLPEELTLFGFDLVLKPFIEDNDAEVPGTLDES